MIHTDNNALIWDNELLKWDWAKLEKGED